MRLERPIGHPDLCEFPGETCSINTGRFVDLEVETA